MSDSNKVVGISENNAFIELKALSAEGAINITYEPHEIIISTTGEIFAPESNQNLDTSASVEFLGLSVNNEVNILSAGVNLPVYSNNPSDSKLNNAVLYFYNDGGVPELRCLINDSLGNSNIFTISLTRAV